MGHFLNRVNGVWGSLPPNPVHQSKNIPIKIQNTTMTPITPSTCRMPYMISRFWANLLLYFTRAMITSAHAAIYDTRLTRFMPSYSAADTPKISPFVNMAAIRKVAMGIRKLSISDMIHSIFAFLLFVIILPLMNHEPRPPGSFYILPNTLLLLE